MKKSTSLNVFLLLIALCLPTAAFATSSKDKNQSHKQEKHNDDHDKPLAFCNYLE